MLVGEGRVGSFGNGLGIRILGVDGLGGVNR